MGARRSTGPRSTRINTGSFNLLAWQFLFVAGVAIGHARLSGSAAGGAPQPRGRRRGGGARRLRLRHPPRTTGARSGRTTDLRHVSEQAGARPLPDGDFGRRRLPRRRSSARGFPRPSSVRPLAFLGRHSLAVVATQSVAIMTLLQFPTLFTATFLGRTLIAAALIARALRRRRRPAGRSKSGSAPPPWPAPIGPRQPSSPRSSPVPMTHERLESQVRFILEVDKLKEVFRQTLCTQSRRPENDAEHSWHLCLAAIVLAEHANEPAPRRPAGPEDGDPPRPRGDRRRRHLRLRHGADGRPARARGRGGRPDFRAFARRTRRREFRALWDEFEEQTTAGGEVCGRDRPVPALSSSTAAPRAPPGGATR